MNFKEHYFKESVVTNDMVYQLVQKIHRDYDDFIDGDLGERLDKYKNYDLKEIDISNLNLEEWDVQDYLVDEIVQQMKQDKNYPPIVVDSQYGIIDGIHRANALDELGFKTIKAYVGIEDEVNEMFDRQPIHKDILYTQWSMGGHVDQNSD